MWSSIAPYCCGSANESGGGVCQGIATAEEVPTPSAYEPVPFREEGLGTGSGAVITAKPVAPVAQDAVVSFEVTLAKGASEDMYGIAQRLTKDGSDTLLVVALKPGGLAERWNAARLSAQNTIRPNDRIVAVNGVTQDATALRMALREPKLTITLWRFPEIFEVRLDRDAGGLYGMRTVRAVEEDGRKMLIVHTIAEDGSLQAWNQRMRQERKFHLIVSHAAELLQVNAKTTPQDMQEELQRSPSVKIIFRRSPANVEVMG